MLLIGRLISLNELNHTHLGSSNKVEALDLVELLRRHQQLALNSDLSSSLFPSRTLGDNSKQIGVLECVAKLPKLQAGQFTVNAQPQVLANQQQQISLDANSSVQHQPQEPVLPTITGPQVVVLPQTGGDTNDDDPDEEVAPPLADQDSLLREGQTYELNGDSLAEDNEAQPETMSEEETATTDDEQQDSQASTKTNLYHDRKASKRSNWYRFARGLHRERRQATTSLHQAQSQQDAQQFLVNSLAQLITIALMNRVGQQRRQRVQLQTILNGVSPTTTLLSSSLLPQQPMDDQSEAVLGAVTPLGQQIVNEILRQSVDDIPVRMANMGQLIARLISTLTISNPMLVNSPLLARVRPLVVDSSTRSSGATLGQAPSPLLAILANVIRSLQQTQPLHPTAQPTLISMQPDVSTGDTSVSSVEPTVPSVAVPPPPSETLDSAASRKMDNRQAPAANKTLDQEAEFVDKLNALTLGQVTSRELNNSTALQPKQVTARPKTRSRPKSKSKSSLKATKRTTTGKPKKSPTRALDRKKRSLGTLLMFGPFSKFYVAMMLHRLMKYQSGVLSQAVMGELVRRYVIPGFSSALTGGGHTLADAVNGGGQQLLNQARQALANGLTSQSATSQEGVFLGSASQNNIIQRPSFTQSGPAANQTNPTGPHHLTSSPANSVLQRFRSAQQESILEQLKHLAPQQRVAEAECHFQSLHDALDPIRFNTLLDIQQLYQLMSQGPMTSMFASALDSPILSIDRERGLTINLPISQTSVTVPNLMSGQQMLGRVLSQQRLSNLMNEHRLLLGNLGGGSLLQQMMHQQHAKSAPDHMKRPHTDKFTAHHRHHHYQHSFYLKPHHPHHHFRLTHHNRVHPVLAHDGNLPPQVNEIPSDNPEDTLDAANGEQMATGPSIGELLQHATPIQLLDLLDKMNVTSSASSSQEKDLGRRSKNKPQTNPSEEQKIGTEDQVKHLQALMAQLVKSIPAKSDAAKNSPQVTSESLSSLADKLLNKTLSSWAESLLAGDLLAQQKETIPKGQGNKDDGRGFGNFTSSLHEEKANDTTKRIHLTLTANTASNLMDKLKSLASHTGNIRTDDRRMVTDESWPPTTPMLTLERHTPTPDFPPPLTELGNQELSNSSIWTSTSGNERDPGQQRPFDNIQLPFDAKHATDATHELPLQQVAARFRAPYQNSSEAALLSMAKQEISGGLGVPFASSPGEWIKANNSNSGGGPSSSLSALAQSVQVLATDDASAALQSQLRQVATTTPIGGRPTTKSNNTIEFGFGKTAKETATVTVTEQQQQQSNSPLDKRRLDEHQRLLGGDSHQMPAPPPIQTQLNHIKLQLPVGRTAMESPDGAGQRHQQVSTMPESRSAISNTSAQKQELVAGFSDNRQPKQQQEQPLNNLAMALNVMNMVMLNQRLMSASNSSNWGLVRETTAHLQPTTISGNFSLNNSQVSLPAAVRLRIHHSDAQQIKKLPPQVKQHNQSRAKTQKLSAVKPYTNKAPPPSSGGGSTTRRPAEGRGSGVRPPSSTPTTTSAPEFVLIDTNGTASSLSLSPSSNHRTSTNAIRQHSSLNVEAKAPPQSKPTTSPKYLYQPLIVPSRNDRFSGWANSSVSSQAPSEPEKDHATRWNDVLKHLEVSSRR